MITLTTAVVLLEINLGLLYEIELVKFGLPVYHIQFHTVLTVIPRLRDVILKRQGDVV
jgi:hypothetical protein